MNATPGWPRRAPGAVRIWLDRMKAYVDAAGSDAPGQSVPLATLDPAVALSAYPTRVVRNGGGSVSLTGGVRVNGPNPGGERRIFTPQLRHLPVQAESHPLAATIDGNDGPVITPMYLDLLTASDGGGFFLAFPEIPDGAFALVWLTSVKYWPAG